MKFFDFCVEQQNVKEWTEYVTVNNFSSETVSDTTFRHVLCFWKWDNHRGLAIIVLRAVTIYRPDTQTNKLKLTLANSSLLSDFCHLNVMLVCLLSLELEKWQNSDKNCKLVTLMSSHPTLLAGKGLTEVAAWALRFQLFISYLATQNILRDFSTVPKLLSGCWE